MDILRQIAYMVANPVMSDFPTNRSKAVLPLCDVCFVVVFPHTSFIWYLKKDVLRDCGIA